ncbi:MAG: succinate dehydrogenase, hydrophobic membrane anchor protein [Alphaproteobacteria bacterium]
MSISHSPLRTHLARVRGLGAAHAGARTWWLERMTSLALIPLSLWFLTGLLGHIGSPREDIAAWLSQPLASIALVLFLLVSLLHGKLGLQTIIEDYVHAHGAKLAIVLFKDVVITLLGVLVLFAIVKLHFIGIR